jgi:hypothetical protein
MRADITVIILANFRINVINDSHLYYLLAYSKKLYL